MTRGRHHATVGVGGLALLLRLSGPGTLALTMSDPLELVLAIAGVIAVFAALGLTAERFRRRKLRAWASEERGRFEAGAFLSGAKVPEAAAFGGEDRVTYRNVTRISRSEASYVVARYSRDESGGIKGDGESSSSVVCFVSLTGAKLPEVDVGRVRSDESWPEELKGLVEPPAPLRVADLVPGFDEVFRALRMSDVRQVYDVTEVDGVKKVTKLVPETAVSSDALARLLPSRVQSLLLAKSDLIAGFGVQGDVVRVEAVRKARSDPYREVFDVARELAMAWREEAPW